MLRGEESKITQARAGQLSQRVTMQFQRVDIEILKNINKKKKW